MTGLRNGTPIHPCMIFGVEIPSPSTKRPPVIRCAVTADIAISAGGRLNTGTIAVPNRIFDDSIDAAAIGANASVLYDSYDHASVYPQRSAVFTSS